MATGWVALVICSRIVNRIPGPESTVISAFIPSFLFLIPIQNYVNMVEIERNPNHKLYGWSFGHTVCLGLGISIWISTLGEIATRILGSSF
jgi:hypothetical protein